MASRVQLMKLRRLRRELSAADRDARVRALAPPAYGARIILELRLLLVLQPPELLLQQGERPALPRLHRLKSNPKAIQRFI